MRTIEEIERDMNLTTGCMCNQHSCDNECEKCMYLNYDKNYYRLREENYKYYDEQDRKKKAIETICADRLEQICKAEKKNRLVVLPCKVGDTVYTIEKYAKTNSEVLGILPKSGYRIKECKFLGIACVDLDTKETEYIVCDITLKVVRYKNIFLTKEEAEMALKGGAE